MADRRVSSTWRALLEIATGQDGYFTRKQAASVGCRRQQLGYHVSKGHLERVGVGLYRVADWPWTAESEMVRLSLWSRGHDDRPAAVVSHETALVVHGLLWPRVGSAIHLTLPPGFRKRAPRGCVLHRALLWADEIEERGGFRVTTVRRAIWDSIRARLLSEREMVRVFEAAAMGAIEKRVTSYKLRVTKGEKSRYLLSLSFLPERECWLAVCAALCHLTCAGGSQGKARRRGPAQGRRRGRRLGLFMLDGLVLNKSC